MIRKDKEENSWLQRGQQAFLLTASSRSIFVEKGILGFEVHPS